MPGARRLGSDAEDKVADYLLGLGWTLIGRRIKLRGGELDIAAFDDEDCLVIVEVKQSARGVPEERLDDRKAEYIFAAAEEFMRLHGMENRLMRFDLIGVVGDEIRHHRDAFRP